MPRIANSSASIAFQTSSIATGLMEDFLLEAEVISLHDPKIINIKLLLISGYFWDEYKKQQEVLEPCLLFRVEKFYLKVIDPEP